MKPIAYHFAVRAKPGFQPLNPRDACVDLWSRLRALFPKVFSSVLMPDHLHVVADVLYPEKFQRALGSLLGGWTRRFRPGESIWCPVSEPAPVRDEQKLLNDTRYVHLNPSRDRLARDPLEWEWSTHRDAMGAVADSWIDSERIAALMRTPLKHFPDRFHRFVSNDTWVTVGGTLAPEPIQRVAASPERVAQAAAMALRTRLSETTGRFLARTLAVHLGEEVAGIDRKSLETRLSLTQKGYSEALRRDVDARAILAAQRLLSEPRYWRGIPL